MTKLFIYAAITFVFFRDARADEFRPDSFAVGIGAGYELGVLSSISSQTVPLPNTFGVRVRLPGGIEIDPRVAITSATLGTGTYSDKSAELRLLAPILRRDRFDLMFVATGAYDRRDGTGLATSGWSLGYGLAIGWWATRHVELSVEATNPIYSGWHDPNTGDFSSFGLVFEPRVTAMAHVFMW